MDEFKVPIVPVTKPLGATADQTPEAESPTACSSSSAATLAIDTKADGQLATNCEAICPYKVPPWSAVPTISDLSEYKFEVLKSGQIIEEIKRLQTKAFWKIGRLPSNDIELAHPTISRYHAILQYKPPLQGDNNGDSETQTKNEAKFGPGWYVYDLASTHGTFLNKQRIPPKTYVRIRVGHMLRLGASTRCFILQGPSEDEEPESELSVTELRAQRQQQEAEREAKLLEAQRRAEERERERDLAGVSWGMTEDAEEETDLTVNPYASTNNEELFLDDPKRTLRGFFEREGMELVYKCEEMSAGSFVCRIELPLDDSNGRPIVAEVIHRGRKKECTVQCALEACRILDRYGVLRQANQEPLKRTTKAADSDDEDEFWDRTGDIERKKKLRTQANADEVLTYDDLLKQEAEILSKIESTRREIRRYQDVQKQQKETKLEVNDGDLDLDGFMQKLKTNENKELDKTEIRKLRLEEQRLNADHAKLKRLLKVAKPFEMPSIEAAQQSSISPSANKSKSLSAKQLPMIGKRNQFSKFKVIKTAAQKITTPKHESQNVDEEEEEEDGDEQTNGGTTSKVIQPSEKNGLEVTNEVLTPESTLHEIQGLQNLTDDESKLNVNDIPKTTKRKTSCDEAKSLDSPPIEDGVEVEGAENANQLHQHEQSNHSAAKKRRQRLRLRSKRADVDIDELAEQESTEKYVKWLPPKNQTGDGMTELNKKFGY